jgi:hypothetical protein
MSSQSTTTTATTATDASQPTVLPADGARADSRNETVIEAIRAHHAELAEQLQARINAVVKAARTGECGRERDVLHEWYRTELMPHIVAEEQALYGPASAQDATRLLIRGMLTRSTWLALPSRRRPYLACT